jgi:hypothetical protein
MTACWSSYSWHDFYFTSPMKEEIDVGGKKAWILIEPHTLQEHEEGHDGEYFTASYSFDALSSGPGVVLFLEDNKTPKRFKSPVQALEYSSEKLLGST